MAELPQSAPSMVDVIYAAIEKEEERGLYLARLGASGIGDECLRATWLSWRAYSDKKFGGRMLRLFRTGHLQEDRIVEDLRRAGYSVWSHTEDGKQFAANDSTGHFVVKLDGVLKGVPGAEKQPHNLEIKTHSKKSFDELVKKKVQIAKPVHYYQMQAGMLFHDLPSAIYVALCKDNEQYYVERIKADPECQAEIQRRIDKLVNADIPPLGISHDAEAFGCKWCDQREACKGEVDPIRTCRSCNHVEIGKTNGEWICTLTAEILPNKLQLETCEHYDVKRVK